MLARWQRRFVLFTLAAMAAWLAWRWPASPAQAVLGALLPPVIFMLVLATQFVLMQGANRADPVPLAGWMQVLAAWWAEVRVALAVFAWRQPFRHGAVPDWLPEQPTGRRGVVLVHGFMCNRGFWLPWLGRLRALGHAHVAVNLEPVMGSIDDYAAIIDTAVARVTQATGRPPVLLCHSMGGLAARVWLRDCGDRTSEGGEKGGEPRVHRVLTLGTPHGGTWLGRFSSAVNGRQMRLQGRWVQALAQAEPTARAALFTCWYSNCDNIVFPASTAALPGADNRFVEGLAHVQMAFDHVVMQDCLDAIGREDPPVREANLK